jgi:hypothetical protein
MNLIYEEKLIAGVLSCTPAMVVEMIFYLIQLQLLWFICQQIVILLFG